LAVALLATGAGAIYELWRVSDLSGKLTKADAKIINLQKQLADANSAIISLQNQSYDSFSAEKALLQRQITQASTTITNLQAQLYEANAKIAGLQRIPNVGEKETIAKDFIILQNANAKTLVASYQAVRSGYLFITGYASTTQGYIQVNDTQYPVSTGISLQIPVVPGELSVYYGNVNFMNSITGTITTVEFWF
jgi:TolA-binding protein